VTSSTVQVRAPLLGSDSFSSWGENPLFHVTRLCLAFVQGLFSYADTGAFHWEEAHEDTEIIIQDEQPIHTDVVGKRPAIITVRSPVAWAGIALDQLQDYDFKTGARTHTDMLSGNMTFNCMSRVKVEAELVAWLVARHCWILRRIMLRSGFHDFGQRNQILAASPPGSIITGAQEAEIINVPVVVPFHFQWQDQIETRNQDVVSAIESRICALGPQEFRPTPVAEGGSPGPGIRGTGLGARVSGLRNLRHPSISGRVLTLTTRTLPNSQQPADPVCQIVTT